MTKQEYQKEWAKKYYSIPENLEKRRLASQKFRADNPDYFKLEKVKLKNRQSALKWYYKNKDKSKNKSWIRKLKTDYRMSVDDYMFLLESQNNVCAVCFMKPSRKRLAIDHCHVTGKVRGLLCAKCNTAIGLLGDDKELVKKAFLYLSL